MMKKILIILFVFIFGQNVFALDYTNTQLSKIENHLFGYDYSNKPKESRLAKVEKEIYGKSKQGKIKDRLAKISKDLCIDVLDEKNYDTNDEYTHDEADNSVDYPVIDNIEQKLGIKPFNKNDLNARLANIENNIFKKINTNDDFYTRVEKIKKKTGLDDINNSYNDYRDYNDEINEYIGDNDDKFLNHPFNTYKLSVLEQKILNDTYPYDNNDRRLSRLENYIFSTNFSEDNDKIRISRLEEAVKSLNYQKQDGSKLQRTINTAMQIATMVLMVLAIIL